MIDTNLGYLASVTSFDLQDFYQLCATMTLEPDLKDMDYVWVDAICVDQTNYERRKATIHQMTTIYERASYILAVPDLHAAYLKHAMDNNKDIMDHICHHKEYIYHLIHGNIQQLHDYDDLYLDSIGVPKEVPLRRLLTEFGDFLTDGFMTFKEHHRVYDPMQVLDHLYDTSTSTSLESSSFSASSSDVDTTDTTNSSGDDDLYPADDDEEGATVSQHFKKLVSKDDLVDTERRLGILHPCNDIHCPLKFSHYATENIYQRPREYHDCDPPWHHAIYERSVILRKSMLFLKDLIMDWSSRVWVISEYSISKKKNNMKFWFTQLTPPAQDTIAFFKFDILDTKLATILNTPCTPLSERSVVLDPVYLTFYQHMIRQLNKQTFVQMMLKSKASKNEDRFHSILPLFPEYNKILRAKANPVESWNIHSMLSVKLKLYELMNTKDKLDLLYLSGKHVDSAILPTFATTTISWQGDAAVQYKGMLQYRDDLTFHFDISLHQGSLYYLHLKPLIYYRTGDQRTDAAMTRDMLQNKKTICKHLDLDDPNETVDMVCIPNNREARPTIHSNNSRFHGDDHFIYLMGSVGKNKWILTKRSNVIKEYDYDWTLHTTDDYHDGFNVY
ncbi:unnamed protein product [Absidia cylindrospora]